RIFSHNSALGLLLRYNAGRFFWRYRCSYAGFFTELFRQPLLAGADCDYFHLYAGRSGHYRRSPAGRQWQDDARTGLCGHLCGHADWRYGAVFAGPLGTLLALAGASLPASVNRPAGAAIAAGALASAGVNPLHAGLAHLRLYRLRGGAGAGLDLYGSECGVDSDLGGRPVWGGVLAGAGLCRAVTGLVMVVAAGGGGAVFSGAETPARAPRGRSLEGSVIRSASAQSDSAFINPFKGLYLHIGLWVFGFNNRRQMAGNEFHRGVGVHQVAA